MPSIEAPKRTVMDRIFDFPLLYRNKISFIQAVMRPIASILIWNKFSEDEVILGNIQAGSSIFEIGCGDGNGYRLFERAGRTVRYAGSDYNAHMVDYCKTHFPEAVWESYNGGPYPHVDGEFDYCVIRHVLHHIPSRDDIVLTISEAIRMASTVVLIEPLQSEDLFLRLVKGIYWRMTDGGVNYMRLGELHAVWEDAGADISWEVWTQPLRQTYACVMTRRPNQTAAER